MSEVILTILQRTNAVVDVMMAAECAEGLMEDASLTVLGITAFEPLLEDIYKEWEVLSYGADAPYQWEAVPTDAVRTVEERGARADLIVIAQPSDDDEFGTQQIFRAALLKTGRPVLVVPHGRASNQDFGRRVAIAWREDRHTAKVVMSALRYILNAEQVFVLASPNQDEEMPAIPGIFSEHRIPVEMHLVTPGAAGAGATLLQTAQKLGADMLILGAYAHSPLHHLVFGRVTRFILKHTDLPVLMRY